VCPKEVAQPHKRTDCFDIIWRLCILNGFQLVFSGFDSFGSKGEAQVGDFLVSEDAFIEVYFQIILAKLIEYLFNNLQMFFVTVREHQEIVDVDNDVLQVAEYSLHQSTSPMGKVIQ